jgi:hypothetical protein
MRCPLSLYDTLQQQQRGVVSSRGGKGSRNKQLQAVSEQMHDKTRYYPRLCKRIDEASKMSDGLGHAPSLRRVS